jgi:hypothetical protein
MKKITLSLLTIFLTQISFSQTTATDFTANDCAGTSHHLFADLDAGKIVVVAFVMPCGSCIAPSQAAYAAVQSFASSNPGKVVFYITDDTGGTSCTTLNTWATTNSMPLATRFSTSSFVMSQYGTSGMPKIVVMGGADHAIVYNQNSGVTTNGVTAAINGLLSAGVSEMITKNDFNMQVVPNPVVNDFKINYTLPQSSNVKLEIFSLTGESVFVKNEENQIQGVHSLNVEESIDLKKGMYVVKLTTDTKTETINFTVTK